MDISALELKDERTQDIDAIYELTQLAFADMPYSDGDEQDVVNRLRDANALLLSNVAWLNGDIVGQVSFSPVTLNGVESNWVALGPVSVTPILQGLGIGGQLIRAGLEHFANTGSDGCILTGNPAYYQRFGFALAPDHCPTNEPPEYFMIHPLNQNKPVGNFGFHPAFYG